MTLYKIKDECYPAKEEITITETTAEVTLQVLVNHTVHKNMFSPTRSTVVHIVRQTQVRP